MYVAGDGSVSPRRRPRLAKRHAAHRIFSMSWSSGSEVFRASTWYPSSLSMSRPVWLTFSSKSILMSCVLNGLSSFGALRRGKAPPQLEGGECRFAVGDAERFCWPQLCETERCGAEEPWISCAGVMANRARSRLVLRMTWRAVPGAERASGCEGRRSCYSDARQANVPSTGSTDSAGGVDETTSLVFAGHPIFVDLGKHGATRISKARTHTKKNFIGVSGERPCAAPASHVSSRPPSSQASATLFLLGAALGAKCSPLTDSPSTNRVRLRSIHKHFHQGQLQKKVRPTLSAHCHAAIAQASNSPVHFHTHEKTGSHFAN